MAIVGQKFIPGLLDMYLGKTGYKSQQIPNEPKDPSAPNNLYDYVPGVHSARGKFQSRSTRSSARFTCRCTAAWWRLPRILRSLPPLVVRSSLNRKRS